jgi:hypothetical protein
MRALSPRQQAIAFLAMLVLSVALCLAETLTDQAHAARPAVVSVSHP